MGIPDSFDDDQLVARIRAGRREALEALQDRHLTHIRLFTAYHAPSFAGVDAVVKATFLFAIKNIQSFKTGTELRGWLRAIAWKLLVAEIQEARASAGTDFDKKRLEELEAAEVDPYKTPAISFLEASVKELPESLQSLVRSKYTEGKSAERIATALGRSRNSVRVGLFRTRQELRRILQLKLKESRNAQ